MLACSGGRSGGGGCTIATSPPLVREKFALLGLMVGECVNKFAQRTEKGLESAVCGVLGELFCDNTVVGAALGELCRG